MSRFPSIKTLTPVFGDRASEARELLIGTRKTWDYASVNAWADQCYTVPNRHDRLMCALNEIAETHGVEVLMGRDEQWPDYEYLNSGDTYTATLIYSNKTGTFRVGCWGDIVERTGNRYA